MRAARRPDRVYAALHLLQHTLELLAHHKQLRMLALQRLPVLKLGRRIGLEVDEHLAHREQLDRRAAERLVVAPPHGRGLEGRAAPAEAEAEAEVEAEAEANCAGRGGPRFAGRVHRGTKAWRQTSCAVPLFCIIRGVACIRT
eukprot:870413-Prymnesium_polylepis.1